MPSRICNLLPLFFTLLFSSFSIICSVCRLCPCIYYSLSLCCVGFSIFFSYLQHAVLTCSSICSTLHYFMSCLRQLLFYLQHIWLGGSLVLDRMGYSYSYTVPVPSPQLREPIYDVTPSAFVLPSSKPSLLTFLLPSHSISPHSHSYSPLSQ